MASMMNYFLLAIVVFVAVCEAGSSSKQEKRRPKSEQDLVEHVLKQAGAPFARPVKKVSKVIDVLAKLRVFEIFPNNDNSLSIAAGLTMQWRHEFIKWNPEHYGGKEFVVIPANKLWYPDVYPSTDTYNNIDDIRRYYETQGVWMYYNGTAIWATGLITRAPCPPEGSFYVKKNCTFQFGSFTHPSSELNLKLLYDFEDVDVAPLSENPEVKLLSHSAARIEQIFGSPTAGTPYWTLNYSLVVKLTTKDHHRKSSSSGSHQKKKKIVHKRRPVKRVAKSSSKARSSDSS